MSYKELKAATDEINNKFNTTRKHLHNILLTLQHKDKELKKIREKVRQDPKTEVEMNQEEEKANDKKIVDYALFLEK
jgi:hypothetical protein